MALTDEQASLMIGKSFSYFSYVKNSNRAKYDYIMSLHKDKVTAYRLFEIEMEQVISEVSHIRYKLLEKELVQAFSEFLYHKGLYANKGSWANSSGKVLYTANLGFTQFGVFMKYKQIPELYEEFKDEHI